MTVPQLVSRLFFNNFESWKLNYDYYGPWNVFIQFVWVEIWVCRDHCFWYIKQNKNIVKNMIFDNNQTTLSPKHKLNWVFFCSTGKGWKEQHYGDYVLIKKSRLDKFQLFKRTWCQKNWTWQHLAYFNSQSTIGRFLCCQN